MPIDVPIEQRFAKKAQAPWIRSSITRTSTHSFTPVARGACEPQTVNQKQIRGLLTGLQTGLPTRPLAELQARLPI